MRKHWAYMLIALVCLIPLGIAHGQLIGATPTEETVTGWLSFLHGDPADRTVPKSIFVVTDDKNKTTEISIDHATGMRYAGKKVSLHITKVSVAGKTVNQVQSVELQAPALDRSNESGMSMGGQSNSMNSAMDMGAMAVTGSRAWVTIACRFGDETGTTPRPTSYFTGLLSNTYPGVDNYWREVSYNQANIAGTVVLPNWYNLPSPRSAYLRSDGSADLGKLTNDCTAAADADVNFPSYIGINLMFNDKLDCCAWGGGWTLNRDGQNKYYSMTWMPPWGYNTQSTIGHEMGHGFGLPHSSGPYGQVYDSKWDVMSGGGTCVVRDATYGCLGVGTISYHRDILGWIGSRKYTAAVNTSATITIERLELPVSTTNYLMAQIPISGTSRFYTVEARLKAGYDQNLPGEGIVIHEVDPSRREPAHVVDPDNNGNPNDAGAVWVPGETFTDSTNKISVAVISRGTSSLVVAITNGTVTTGTATIQPPTNTPQPVTPTKTSTPTVTPTATSTLINFALNKTATGNGNCASTETPNKAVDGTVANNSKWCGFVSNGAAWLKVDLGAVYQITSFKIKHAGAGGESTSMNTKAFQIQYSADGNTNWYTLVNVTANTQSITTHNIMPTNARYLRLYITVPENQYISNAARIYEFEVYGNGMVTGASGQNTPRPPVFFAPPTNTPVRR